VTLSVLFRNVWLTKHRFFLYILFCLSCACCLLGDTRDRGLLYYCERCGLRLVTDDNKGSQVRYDSSTLMPKPEETKGGQATPGSKVARSPLGLPPPLNRPDIVNIKARYQALTPVRKLIIETERFGLPTKVTDPSNTTASTYVIESPGIPPEDPGAKKKERQFLQYHCAWALGSSLSRQTPHFRVNRLINGASKELAWVKLFGGSNWDAEIHVAVGEMTDDKTSFVERRLYAAEESDWSTSGPGVLWTSSEGLLLWSMRTLRDAEGVNTRALCCGRCGCRKVVGRHGRCGCMLMCLSGSWARFLRVTRR
jgi:hypothetical protein